MNSYLEVNKEKFDLLNQNKVIGNEKVGTSIDQLKLAVKYYSDEISKIKTEDLAINKKIKSLESRKERLNLQLKDPVSNRELPTSEIEIIIDSDGSVNAKFEISYIAQKAGWFPKYDIRAKDIKSPIKLDYKASVYQNTGEDWEDVNLTLSNVNPKQSSTAPVLDPWKLNYARYTVISETSQISSGDLNEVKGKVISSDDGMGLPGVNVVIKGTTIGTVTDENGFYSVALPRNAKTLVFAYVGFGTKNIPINKSMINVVLEPDVTALQEVVVTGYSRGGSAPQASRQKAIEADRIVTTFVENQTTLNFEVKRPYTVKSSGESILVDLNQYESEAIYQYYAVPKLDQDAFLIAKILNWDQYGLLEGEANLYFEDTFIGRTILNVNVLSDTLNISLGRDKNVIIQREKVDEFTKRRSIGSNKIESRGFKISIRNNKSESINLSLIDQIPVSTRSEIQVDLEESNNAILEKDTGELKWIIELAPKESKELQFQYEVKFPKDERVILE